VRRAERERVLTTRELNRALLARQLLLRRARLPVGRAIERAGALQAQWPPAPYIALWTRLEGFSRAQLVRAVERRQVVKATLHRATLHHVSARDYLAYAGLYREARRRSMRSRAERAGIEAEVERLAAAIVEHSSVEPYSRPELLERLGLPKLATDVREWVVWHLLAAEAELVHTPESSAWRRHTQGGRFVPARAWLGRDGATGEAAAAHLARRYLAAFGPATRADLAQWTGLGRAALDPGLARLPLRRFRDERGRELLDLPRAPRPDPETPAPARLLPTWDSTLLAHDDRSRILPDEHRRTVILRNGNVQQAFLVDGFVAGLWRFEDGRVELEPFAPLPRRARGQLETEAAALARWLA
jgi:hypothetical protein